jgi:DNA-binding MarR family transcriptional regulator
MPETELHPTAELDETVHQRVRLGVLAILSEADRATFTYLRDTLDVTDGNLSAHVAVLAKAGLVRIDKGFVDNRPRTWVRATAKGRSTFQAEISALSKLVGRYRGDIAGSRR